MKKLLASVVFLGVLASGCNKTVEPKTEEEKTFYAIGTMFGSRLTQLSMSDAEIDAMAQGLRDAAKNEKLLKVGNRFNTKKGITDFPLKMSKSLEDFIKLDFNGN